MSEPFYTAFLEELSELDAFLARRVEERPPIFPLDREDPDVRRLLEAMAFFSARTRALCVDNLKAATSRLSRGVVEYLLTPMPAMAMMQAVVNERLVDPAYLPQGAEVRVVAPDGKVGFFSTTRGLSLLPIHLRSVELLFRLPRGFRLVLRVDARVPLRGASSPLRFFLDHLGDYHASLALMQRLREHVERASVFYDEPPDEASSGAPCELSFGCPEPEEGESPGNPIEQIRSFFHFPAQELFLDARLPDPKTPWSRAFLCLDLDDKWPTDQGMTAEMFQLFVVPIKNLKKDPADQILCDGTQDGYPIVAATKGDEPTLHSILGVYQFTARGLSPILSGSLPGKGASYEIEEPALPESEPHRLLLDIPDAFEKPRKILVEALWYQPEFEASAKGKLSVSLQKRHIPGATFRTRGGLVTHRKSPLRGDPMELLHVLSLKTKTVLTREELLYLMEMLGADRRGYHRGIADAVSEVNVHEVPGPSRRGEGVKRVYQLVLAEVEPDREGLLWGFLGQVWALLDAWIAEAVDLDVTMKGMGPKKLLAMGIGS